MKSRYCRSRNCRIYPCFIRIGFCMPSETISALLSRKPMNFVSYSYIIKEYDGNIAVFKAGESTLIKYEVPVETLPEEGYTKFAIRNTGI